MSTIFYGYGFQLDDEDINPTKFLNFLKSYPKDYDAYKGYLEAYGEEENTETTLDWVRDHYFSDRFCNHGLPAFLCQKMVEEEGIDFFCDGYTIIFPENLPWNYNRKERTITVDEIDDIFDKWIEKISDEVFLYDELVIGD